ncbi:GTP binding [Balamuthia mandrillaris]
MSFLSTPDLIRCFMVCREWNALRREPFLLKLLTSTTSSSVLMLDAPKRRRILAMWLPCEDSYKVVVLGEGGTGRMSFIRRVTGEFDYLDQLPFGLLGLDRFSKTVEIDGKDVVLEFAPPTKKPYKDPSRNPNLRNGDCFLIFYSVTSRQTFEAVPPLVELIRQAQGGGRGKRPPRGEPTRQAGYCDMIRCPPIIIIGNKMDLASSPQQQAQREVSFAEGKRLADSLLVYRWNEDEPRSKKKKHKSEKKGGFVFRKNFFEMSVKNNIAMFHGVDVEHPHTREDVVSVVVEEVVRQIDEWRYRRVLREEKEILALAKNNTCLLM